MKNSKRLLWLGIAIGLLFIGSRTAEAARHFVYVIDYCNDHRVLKLYQWEKVYEVVLDSKKIGVPSKGGVLKGVQAEQVITDDRNLYIGLQGEKEAYITTSSLKKPSRILSTCPLNAEEIMQEHSCTGVAMKLLKKCDKDKLLVLVNTKVKDKKGYSSIISIFDVKTQNALTTYYHGDLCPSPILNGNKTAYFKGTDDSIILTLDLQTGKYTTREADFKSKNVQVAEGGKLWWIFDEEKKDIIKYNPATGEIDRSKLVMPKLQEGNSNGYYIWNREPFIYFKNGMVFQVIYTHAPAPDKERVNVVKKLMFFDYETREVTRIGPSYIDGYYLGFRPRADGYMVFLKEPGLKQLYVYKMNREHEVEYRRNFGYSDAENQEAFVNVSDYCYLIEPESKISTFSPNLTCLVVMKKTMPSD